MVMVLPQSPRGLYYKTLQVCNLQNTNRFRSKLVLFLLSVTHTLAFTNAQAYYGNRTLQFCNCFIEHAAGPLIRIILKDYQELTPLNADVT
jgi:hypothetical protein